MTEDAGLSARLSHELARRVWEYVADARWATVVDDLLHTRFLNVALTPHCNDVCVYKCVRQYFEERPHFGLANASSALLKELYSVHYLDAVVRAVRHYRSYGRTWYDPDARPWLADELRATRAYTQRVHDRHEQRFLLDHWIDDDVDAVDAADAADAVEEDDAVVKRRMPLCSCSDGRPRQRARERQSRDVYANKSEKYNGKPRNGSHGYNAARFDKKYGMPVRRAWSPKPTRRGNGPLKGLSYRGNYSDVSNKLARRCERREEFRSLNANNNCNRASTKAGDSPH